MDNVYCAPPKINVMLVDNVFVKMHHFANAGDRMDGHAHSFDHISLLATGSVLMKRDDGEQTFKAPELIVTPKGMTHQFIALEPNTTFCCIHAVRDGDGVDDVAPQSNSPEEQWELLSKYHPVTKG